MALSESASIRVAVLGPVLIEGRGGTLVEPPGTLGKSLVASPALERSRGRSGTLSVAGLVDDLWADEPPRNGRAALQTLVSRIRSMCAEGLLESGGAGYGLAVTANETDVGRAAALLVAARASAGSLDFAAAESQSNEALALWRGDLGTGLSPALRTDLKTRAEELRRELRRVRVQARLALGDPEFAIAELRPLAAAAPLDEDLHLRSSWWSWRACGPVRT